MEYRVSGGSEEEYNYSSDWEAELIENEDSDSPSKVSSCKVITRESLSAVITRESLSAAQGEDLRRVMDLLLLSERHARVLLIHHRWDIEKLMAVYVEKGKAFLFSEAGLVAGKFIDLARSSTVMCNICMDDVPAQEVTTMDCGHRFCDHCWTEHFAVKINEGRESKRIKCMAHECNCICDEAIVRKLVSIRHPDLAKKFQRFLLESYIEDNKKVKWCPSIPHCGNAIRVENDEFCEVECSCGSQFCLGCLSKPHSPCSCLMWELWTKECQDKESDSAHWIIVHTKPCPNCHKPIEKNGGCNLVRCICGKTFSWLRAGATARELSSSDIPNQSYGHYEEDDENRAKPAKPDRHRFVHYYDRYRAHMDSFKQESRLSETVEEKISSLEAKDSKLRDFSWVTNGLNWLFRSRKYLSYSYPFAFYMFGEDLFKYEMTIEEREIKKNLFEALQQLLESNVEKLSKFLEKPFDRYSEEQVMHIRMQIINLSAVTDNLCKKMYECIDNDLLGSLQFTFHSVTPYQSKGIEKAQELMVVSSAQSCGDDHRRKTVDHLDGDILETECGRQMSSTKRARKEIPEAVCLVDH